MADKPLTPAEKVERAFRDLEPYTLHAGQVLVQWIEEGSDGQVALIRFNEDQHPFKEFVTNEDGRQQTRIVHAIFIEADDAGEPIHQARRFQLANATLKGGEFCKKFHILIGEVDFARWLFDVHHMKDLAAMDPPERKAAVEERVRAALFPDGQSSKLLDHDPSLRRKFVDTYYRPYMDWRQERAERQR